MILKWLGLAPYIKALDIQNEFRDLIFKGAAPVVIACEHPSVITLGKRGDKKQDILFTDDELLKRGVETVNIDRGGQAVMHNPGQLVIYPIIPIGRLSIGVKDYVNILEEVTQEIIESFGIDVHRSVEPGLWVQEKKIAYIGIRVKGGVTLHGVCINVSNNLEELQIIKQCGRQVEATSLQRILGKDCELKKIAELWFDLFRRRIVKAAAKTSLGVVTTSFIHS